MSKEVKIELRNLVLEDYKQLKSSMQQAYSGLSQSYWKEESIEKLLNIFPDGQLCILVNDVVVGAALSLIIDYDKFGDNHTYSQIIGNYTFNTHTAAGDILYGIDVFIHPDYRGMRLARRLYHARKEICENLNLKSIMAGGRIPNYEKYAHELTPRQYIDKVKHKEIYDPTLTFQLSNDFHVKKVLKGYLPSDTQSKEYATLLEWNNVYYTPQEKLINNPRNYVRVGLV
jgi:ribosomal protein S18 acetylase RimI-like enzyme